MPPTPAGVGSLTGVGPLTGFGASASGCAWKKSHIKSLALISRVVWPSSALKSGGRTSVDPGQVWPPPWSPVATVSTSKMTYNSTVASSSQPPWRVSRTPAVGRYGVLEDGAATAVVGGPGGYGRRFDRAERDNDVGGAMKCDDGHCTSIAGAVEGGTGNGRNGRDAVGEAAS